MQKNFNNFQSFVLLTDNYNTKYIKKRLKK